MNLDSFFYEHPVFRHEEFAAWKAKQGIVNPNSINTALWYYVNSERIKPIRRKLYAVIPPGQSAETVTVDSYLIAGKATEDAIISHHSALELMGVAYSNFGQLTYLTEQKSKPFQYQDNWFQSVSVSTALRKKQLSTRYVNTIDRQGVLLRITNPTRTFVDVLDRIELSGGLEEVCRSIANIAVLNVDEVINYSLSLDNARLAAMVGYFLSLRKGAFSVDVKQLKPLLQAVPKIAPYVPKKTNERFQLVKPWNILLPISVIHQTWEEPNDPF